MAQHNENRPIDGAVELLKTNDFDGLAEAVTVLLNSAMVAERSEHLGAAPYERSAQRVGYANGDWDLGIAIDVLEAAKDVDTVVLLSGDGDFDLLLEKIKKDYAISTEVYGVPALTANSLIEAANIYHRIDEDLLL